MKNSIIKILNENTFKTTPYGGGEGMTVIDAENIVEIADDIMKLVNENDKPKYGSYHNVMINGQLQPAMITKTNQDTFDCVTLKGNIGVFDIPFKKYRKVEVVDFETASRPLIRYLNEKRHPHVTAIVTTTSCELMEGLEANYKIFDYVKD